MSLQSIIDIASGMDINRRKVVGTQITKSEIPRTSVTPTKNPWQFRLDVPGGYRYSDMRTILERLDYYDRYLPQVVTFNRPCIDWIFRYRGQMTPSQISAITVSSFEGNQLTLTNLPTSGILFYPNDLIQIGTLDQHPYPYTVVNAVTGGSGTAVITTHRPNIITADVTGAPIIVGAECQFKVFCPNMPTYKLVPGGAEYRSGSRINNALIEFSDSFQFYEYVGDA